MMSSRTLGPHIFIDSYILYRLIIASRFHPEPILMSLIQFVAPSRPFVVYCQLMEVCVIVYFLDCLLYH